MRALAASLAQSNPLKFLAVLSPILDRTFEANTIHELAIGLLGILEKNMRFESVGFYFINPDTEKLELIYALGLTEDERIQAERTAMERHPGQVLRTKMPYFSNNESLDKMGGPRQRQSRARIYCPLIYKTECIGTIGVTSSEVDAFDGDDLEFLQFAAVITTVTYERILFENKLRRSRERLALACEALNFGVWDFDYRSDSLVWDDFMYRLFEVDKHNFTGAYAAFEQCLHPDDRERVKEELAQTSQLNKDSFASEFRILTPQGKTKTIKAQAKCLYDEQGKLQRLVGANWDVTRERETELKLIESSRLSSLGQMASSIGHEINNPVAVIVGRTSFIGEALIEEPIPFSKIRISLDKILAQCERIQKIVRGMKAVSRQGDQDPIENTLLVPHLEECLDLFRDRLRRSQVELKVTGDWSVSALCRPAHLMQTLVNLINNSIDAIESHKDTKWIELGAKETAGFIEISVTDSGLGIPEKVASRMLEPFFTTKGFGAGTGLGLSISKGLIESGGGQFFYDRNCPHTRFVIQLPKQSTER